MRRTYLYIPYAIDNDRFQRLLPNTNTELVKYDDLKQLSMKFIERYEVLDRIKNYEISYFFIQYLTDNNMHHVDKLSSYVLCDVIYRSLQQLDKEQDWKLTTEIQYKLLSLTNDVSNTLYQQYMHQTAKLVHDDTDKCHSMSGDDNIKELTEIITPSFTHEFIVNLLNKFKQICRNNSINDYDKLIVYVNEQKTKSDISTVFNIPMSDITQYLMSVDLKYRVRPNTDIDYDQEQLTWIIDISDFFTLVIIYGMTHKNIIDPNMSENEYDLFIKALVIEYLYKFTFQHRRHGVCVMLSLKFLCNMLSNIDTYDQPEIKSLTDARNVYLKHIQHHFDRDGLLDTTSDFVTGGNPIKFNINYSSTFVKNPISKKEIALSNQYDKRMSERVRKNNMTYDKLDITSKSLPNHYIDRFIINESDYDHEEPPKPESHKKGTHNPKIIQDEELGIEYAIYSDDDTSELTWGTENDTIDANEFEDGFVDDNNDANEFDDGFVDDPELSGGTIDDNLPYNMFYELIFRTNSGLNNYQRISRPYEQFTYVMKLNNIYNALFDKLYADMMRENIADGIQRMKPKEYYQQLCTWIISSHVEIPYGLNDEIVKHIYVMFGNMFGDVNKAKSMYEERAKNMSTYGKVIIAESSRRALLQDILYYLNCVLELERDNYKNQFDVIYVNDRFVSARLILDQLIQISKTYDPKLGDKYYTKIMAGNYSISFTLLFGRVMQYIYKFFFEKSHLCSYVYMYTCGNNEDLKLFFIVETTVHMIAKLCFCKLFSEFYHIYSLPIPISMCYHINDIYFHRTGHAMCGFLDRDTDEFIIMDPNFRHIRADKNSIYYDYIMLDNNPSTHFSYIRVRDPDYDYPINITNIGSTYRFMGGNNRWNIVLVLIVYIFVILIVIIMLIVISINYRKCIVNKH